MKRFFDNRGFTFIEMLMGLGVVSILAVSLLAAINPAAQLRKGRDSRRKKDLEKMQTVLEDYYNDHDHYPATFISGASFEPYLTKVPSDPKNEAPYIYYYTTDGSNRPSWYKIYVKLEYEADPVSVQAGCETGCGPEEDGKGVFNYWVASPNVHLAMMPGEIWPWPPPGLPTSTPTPVPVPTNTSTPAATSTPSPAPTATPLPTSTSTSTPTPTPLATSTPSPTPTPAFANLIQNPGFEDGTNNWRFYTNGSGSFTSSTADHYEGSRAARISISSSGDNVQLYQYDISLEPNTNYRLSFAAYSNTGHDLDVYIHKHGSPYTNYGLSRWFGLGTSWNIFSVDFTSNASAGPDARLRFWLAPYGVSGDVYWFDQVELKRI